MADPDPHDDTSADYEQFEKALLAQDRDAAGVDTTDIDEVTARRLVDDLIDADVVTSVPGGPRPRSRTECYCLRLVDAAARLPPWLDGRPRRRRGEPSDAADAHRVCVLRRPPPGAEVGEAHT